MPPPIASAACSVLILALFWLDRDKQIRTSFSLWIPVIWVMLACSRSVSQWLQVGPPTDSANQVLEGSPLDRNVYMCLIAIGLIVLATRGRRVGRVLWANGPILFFFCYCVFSLLWSDYPDVAFKRWTKALGDLVMVLIVLSDLDPVSAFKRLLARVSYFLIPLSILFIKYYPNLGVGYSLWGGSKATYTGVTMSKNSLGVDCLCFGLVALWRLLADYQNQESPNRTRHMIAQGVLLSMVFWLFWLANSMTSINSFLMAGILLFVGNSRKAMRRPIVIHLLIVSMLAVSTLVAFFGASPELLQAMGRNPTLTDRTEVWGNLLILVRHPLIGTGFESFWLGPRLEKLWSIYWWHPNEAHNGYLEIYLNLGWIGLTLLALVIVTGYRTVLRTWRRNPSTGSLWLSFFFVGLVYNFTEAAFFKMLAPAWIFYLFATIGAPFVQAQPSEQNLYERSSPLVGSTQAQAALHEEVV